MIERFSFKCFVIKKTVSPHFSSKHLKKNNRKLFHQKVQRPKHLNSHLKNFQKNIVDSF